MSLKLFTGKLLLSALSVIEQNCEKSNKLIKYNYNDISTSNSEHAPICRHLNLWIWATETENLFSASLVGAPPRFAEKSETEPKREC